jgi:hypothetical protein
MADTITFGPIEYFRLCLRHLEHMASLPFEDTSCLGVQSYYHEFGEPQEPEA